jgi:hypothetical protein
VPSRFRNRPAGTLCDTVPFAGGNSAAPSRQAALLNALPNGCRVAAAMRELTPAHQNFQSPVVPQFGHLI